MTSTSFPVTAQREPVGLADSAVTPMPETDWLTGLASRAAFVRQVVQADRDRDRFAVAVVSVNDFGELNRQLGYDAGDDLLRELGRTMAAHGSVDSLAGRLGGAEFGLLAASIPEDGLHRWLSPIVTALRSAVVAWTFEQLERTGDYLIEPELVVGVSSGHSDEVWTQAALALQAAKTDPAGPGVVEFRADDPRVVALRRRRSQDQRVEQALGADGLVPLAREIEAVGGRDDSWRWTRLGVAYHADDGTVAEVDTGRLSTGVGRRVEHWLAEQAARLIAEGRRHGRVTLPIAQQLLNGRAFNHRLFPILERHRVPPSRMVFEIDERDLAASLDRGRYLIGQLTEIGFGTVLGHCDGGWRTWRLLEQLPIGYAKPKPELMDRAAAGDPAGVRVLEALATNAEAADCQLIAPFSSAAPDAMAAIGFTFAEQGRAAAVLPA